MSTERHAAAKSAEIDEMLQRCIQELPSACTEPIVPKTANLHVVLTGSTGSIGQHLLLALIRSSTVSKVTCIDRKPNSAERLEPMLVLEPKRRRKIVCVQGQTAKPKFGLSASDLLSLNDVDVFLANAWPVNWALPLPFYEKQLIGLARTLCGWATEAPSRPRLVLVSSFGSIDKYSDFYSGRVPEAVVDDGRVANGPGYAASKNIAERLFGAAAKQSNIPITILRLGQISGAIDVPRGISSDTRERFIWSRREYVYMNILTSRNLGKVSREDRRVDWIPVDSLVQILLEILQHDLCEAKLLTVYNVMNAPVQWSTLASMVAAHLFSNSHPGQIVDNIEEWLEPLRKLDVLNPEHVKKFPSIQILPLIEV